MDIKGLFLYWLPDVAKLPGPFQLNFQGIKATKVANKEI